MVWNLWMFKEEAPMHDIPIGTLVTLNRNLYCYRVIFKQNKGWIYQVGPDAIQCIYKGTTLIIYDCQLASSSLMPNGYICSDGEDFFAFCHFELSKHDLFILP